MMIGAQQEAHGHTGAADTLHAMARLAKTMREQAPTAPKGLRALTLSAATDPAATPAELAFLSRHIALYAEDVARAGFLDEAAATERLAALLARPGSTGASDVADPRLEAVDH